MKVFDVKITGSYEKSIEVLADNAHEARAKCEMILLETNLLGFDDEDFSGMNVDICEQKSEEEEEQDEPCDRCEYCCPVCGECMYEGGDNR